MSRNQRATVSPSQVNTSGQWNSGRNGQPREWSYKLCSCCDDKSECCLAFFCPPCYTCRLLKRMDEHCCSCWCGGCVPIRTKIRVQRRIKGDIPKDCFTFMCCPCCTLTQMGREVKDTASLL